MSDMSGLVSGCGGSAEVGSGDIDADLGVGEGGSVAETGDV